MKDSEIQSKLMEELGAKNRSELSKRLGIAYSLINHISRDERQITSEYKVRCAENLRRPGYRFNIFWFEDPEKHPFWVPEDYWLNQFDPDIQVIAQLKPDFMEALKRVARLPPEKQERWLNMARDLFNLGEG